jgi:hypothetical protein
MRVYPTFPFVVQGHLNTTSGVPVANATISISAFKSVTNTTTDSNGHFNASLIAPANATDGIHQILVSFPSMGAYAPSSSSILVDVVREPLNVTVNSPQFVVSGFGGRIAGTVLANGSAIANTNVTINTPWGLFHTETDSLGGYNTSFAVPITSFAIGGQVVVSVNPSKPYIESAQSFTPVTVVNPIEIGALVVVLGLVLLGVKNSGMFSAMTRKQAVLRELPKSKSRETTAISEPGNDYRSRMIFAYDTSLAIAGNRFKKDILSSMTFREAISEISELDHQELGSKLFSSIALTIEDLIYAKKFDFARIEEAEATLAKLKELWK